MRTQFRVLCFMLLSFLFLTGMTKSISSQIVITPDQETFYIEVKAIPTTGYTWSVTSYDKKQFSFEGSNYVKSTDNSLVGAPQQEQFHFKLLKPLSSPQTIVLSLARAWEHRDIQQKSFEIVQKVETPTNKE